MKKEAVKKHFLQYAASFKNGIKEVDINVQLKMDHTLRVLEEAEHLAHEENFSVEECLLLEYSCLFHDLSRFEQFAKFQTYNDIISFDHGERSYELIQNDNWLPEELSEREKKIISTAVRYHNKRFVPPDLAPEELKILFAVRDADKTDIFNILLNHLKNPENPAIVYKLSDFSGLSEKVAAAIMAEKSPDNADLETETDFIAAKFAWGFDLNYGWTCREFLKRDYFKKLRTALPEQTEMLDICLEKVVKFIQKKGNV